MLTNCIQHTWNKTTCPWTDKYFLRQARLFNDNLIWYLLDLQNFKKVRENINKAQKYDSRANTYLKALIKGRFSISWVEDTLANSSSNSPTPPDEQLSETRIAWYLFKNLAASCLLLIRSISKYKWHARGGSRVRSSERQSGALRSATHVFNLDDNWNKH